MKTSAGTDKQHRSGAILSRIAGALSFARLALLVGKTRAPSAASIPGPARNDVRGEARPKAGRAAPAGVPPSAKTRGFAPPAAPARRPPQPTAQAAADRAAVVEGSRRERARWAAIIMSEHGQRNPQLAAKLADTDMSVKEALAVLELTPAAVRGSFHHPDRAARNPQLAAVAVPSLPPTQAAAARMDHAMAEARLRASHRSVRP
jgi:hypothetical protein